MSNRFANFTCCVLIGIALLVAVASVDWTSRRTSCAERYQQLMLQRACLALPNCHNTVEGITRGQAHKKYIQENCPKEAAEDAVWSLMQGATAPDTQT